MQFDDISVKIEFIEDYDKAPKEIKNVTDLRLRRWSIIGRLPSSAQAHRAHTFPFLWIIYLNKGRGGWRLLATIDNRMLTLHRLLDHDDVDKALRV